MATRKRDERWIQEAIKSRGALRSAASRAGALTRKGTIDSEWLAEQAKKGGTIGRRARLAQTLRKLNKGRG